MIEKNKEERDLMLKRVKKAKEEEELENETGKYYKKKIENNHKEDKL